MIAMRMYGGKMLDETTTPWYKNYLTYAQEHDIFADGVVSANVGTMPATR